MFEFNHKSSFYKHKKEGAKSPHFTSVRVSVHINKWIIYPGDEWNMGYGEKYKG